MQDYSVNELIEKISADTIIIPKSVAEIYNCLIAKHVYYNNQGKLHESGWFYSTVKDLHLSSGYAEDAQKSAIRHVLIIVRNYAIFHEMQIILSIVLLQDIKKYIVLNQE